MQTEPIMNHAVPSTIILEAEIDCLMRRLIEVEPNAIYMLEKLLANLRLECFASKKL